VIAVSSDVRDTLVRSGTDPARVTVLLNGIDPSAFQREPRRRDSIRGELGLDPSHQVIGAVGRLEPQKRFDLLLDAFARLRTEWPDARLVIVGDGSLRDTLVQHAARLGLADVCHCTGHRLDIAALHNAFDLFVQSSEYEGTPNAVLEAMAMETPIVATDVGGTRELAFDDVHGLIVPPHDVSALRAAMAASLADPDAARRRARAARARIEGELSFAERTRRLEEVYDTLVAERDRSRPQPSARRPVGVPGA
jgi:glycosyltransferase involved in cell wall biosynthesis